MRFSIITDYFLNSTLAKRGELLENLNSYLEKGNQHPSSSNESVAVDEKVQRLTSEESQPIN